MGSDEFVVDFPTLWVTCDWIEQHCVVPDGFRKGEPFEMYDWQLWCTANHYRIRPAAEVGQLAPAFHFRRSQVVAPQKTGKGPWTASICAVEGVGPAVFNGWASGGELYDCRCHGCGCGWLYEYEPGEPMAIPWPTPLVQITAFSEEQTDNVYRPLQSMIRSGPLGELMKVGEQFIRLPGDGRIDVVTSSAQSRLGNPVTFVLQDECMDLRTPIPTPSGWTTMGDIQVGDRVFGRDGQPCKVVRVAAIHANRTCFCITFGDGSSVVTDSDHKWEVYDNSPSFRTTRTVTTQDLFDLRWARQSRFRLVTPSPVELPDAELAIDPYLLGAWLGDGSKSAAMISCGEDDLPYLVENVERAGYSAKVVKPAERAPFVSVTHPTRSRKLSLLVALRNLGVLGQKHIPLAYLRASHAQRLALLQGLMDTDGHVTETGHCTFVNSDRRLALGVLELLRTLGMRPRLVAREDGRWSKPVTMYKVNFVSTPDLIPFRMPRKVARCRTAPSQLPSLSKALSVTAVERVDTVPVRCIEVDSEDHLFLVGESMMPTHNTQLWTVGNKMTRVAETQRRGAAGMGGRSMETTNAWDPSENSVAQRTAEAKVKDIFRFHRKPPAELKYSIKADRRRIHRHVYAGSSHVDLDAIEAEAAELIEVDPAQAERFFGNRITAGTGTWLARDRWELRAAPRDVPGGTPVVLGFDGSDIDDWTGIRAETLDGYQFTPVYSSLELPTIWDPKEWGGQTPRLEVDAAVDELMRRYKVVRMYCDPPYWETEVDTWADRHGEKRVVRWYTQRIVQMHAACERLVTDVTKADSVFTHDGCEDTAAHVGHARRAARPADRYVLRKAAPHQKIDLAVVSILAHEAAGDAIAAGLARPKKSSRTTVMR